MAHGGGRQRGRRRRIGALVTAAVVVALGAWAPPASASAGSAARTPARQGAPSPTRYLDPTFDQVTVTKGLVYGAAPDFGGKGTQTLRLDLYEPTGDTEARRPVVVLAFGGGFWFGNREQMASKARGYAARGFVVASIDYRLDEDAGPIRYPLTGNGIQRVLAAKWDMQAAVRWLRANAVDLRLDPGKVAVGGLSAGGVTALMTALMPDDAGTSGTPGLSSSVCTAISMSGTGGPFLAGPGDAGAIFFHGDADRTVPIALARETERAMREAGLPTRFVTYPGGGHDIAGTQAADVEERSSQWLVEQMVAREDSCAGPIDPAARAFATAAHHDFLGRAPTDDELARAVSWLDSGGSRASLLTDLTTSDAWLGSLVTDLYRTTLGRAPDAAGLAHWIGVLRSGRLTVARVAASFYASPEYHAGPGGGTDEGWVAALYEAVLGRPAASGDLAYWTGQIATRGRRGVAAAIGASVESRRQRVAALYQHLLGRAPDAAGAAHWVEQLRTVDDLALARSLAGSQEYRTRAVARFP